MLIIFFLLFTNYFDLERNFSVPEGFQDVEIEQKLPQDCFEFSKKVLSKFVIDFHPEHPLFLQNCWRKTNNDGDFVILQVQRNLLRYQITIHIPNLAAKPEKKYIVSVKSIENETERNSHWIVPSENELKIAMNAVQEKFGDDVQLKNVVFYKIIKIGRIDGQLVIDAENDLERMLLNTHIVLPYGENEYKVEYVNRIY